MIQVAAVDKLALMAMKARHVRHDEGDDRPAELFGVDVADEIMNHANAVQLVPMNRCRQAEHRTIPLSTSN
jgi:hypothetical protein